MANQQYKYQFSGNGFNLLPTLILGLLFLLGLFFIARFVFNILMYLAPVLLIITLFLDHKVVVNYGKWIGKILQENPLLGTGLILLTFFGFPVVSLFLFGKAMIKKKVKEVHQQMEQKMEGMYTDYEEVESEEAEWVELPPPPIAKKRKSSGEGVNHYDDLFDE